MKRTIIYLVLIILLTSLGLIGYLNQPVYYPNDVLDKLYYKYDYPSGTYDDIKIQKTGITYNGTSFNLNGCKSYSYNKDTGIIKMDCGRAFRIIYMSDNMLVLNIENLNYYFYKEKEDSYNKEFNLLYDMTYNDLEFEANEKLSKVKLDSEQFNELLNNNEKSYILIKNDNCKSNCIYVGNDIDSLLTEKIVYYIETTDLTEELTNLITDFNSDILSSEAAVLVEVLDNQISNVYFISTKGFNRFSGYLDDKVSEGD